MLAHSTNSFLPTIILMFFGVLIVGITLVVSKWIRPSNPTKLKKIAYECGEEPTGVAWSHFNVRFYVVGLIFIIFDVESVLMFPLVTVFKRFVAIGQGAPVLIIFLSFISVLIEGIAYCWRKGDLDWIKTIRATTNLQASNKN